VPVAPSFEARKCAHLRMTTKPLRRDDACGRLPVRAADDVHQLGDLAALVGLVARGDGMLDAMGDMVAQDFLLDPA
jgi:hypothetical protein